MTSDNSDPLTERVHTRVAEYYTGKLREHGATPRGADWRDAESQEMRFSRLLRIFDGGVPESLIEIGCGYGALCGYLRRTGVELAYTGYDISAEMVAAARAAYADVPSARFEVGSRPRERAGYCVASGIFNVRFDFPGGDWRAYVNETIDTMAAAADKGFAFNFLTRYADWHEERLFYADPGEMLNHCIARYGRMVSILHGAPPYEFTVLVWHGGSAR